MAKDSQFCSVNESFDDFTIINEAPTQTPEQSRHAGYGFAIEGSSLSIDLHNYVFPPRLGFGTQVQPLRGGLDIECDDSHESDSVFKFLDQILMEETKDEKHGMVLDPLALQATEKSFYDVIDKKYPPSPSVRVNIECPGSLCERTSEINGNCVDPLCTDDPGYYEFSVEQFYISNRSIQSSFTNSQPLVHSISSSMNTAGGQFDSFMNMNLIPNQFSDSESKLLFWKGVEEARKFLPTKTELIVDLDNYTLAPKPEKEPPQVEVRVEKDHSSSDSRGRKNPRHKDGDLDVRSSKQSALYEDEDELLEMFDNILLRDFEGVTVSFTGEVKLCNGIDKYRQLYQLSRVPRSVKVSKKKKESDAIFLQSLLLSCAEAIASDDLEIAHKQLLQIRQHASSTGDACQRVANLFANGLEARLAGTGNQIYSAFASKRMSGCEILKAYQVYISACPFIGNSAVFTHNMILKIAARGSTLHIVDFGISYGYKWALLIQFLSVREGGPPKLRITGIDFPQAGFRPAECIEEAGKRLARHCKRLNVPFEYQAVARQNWDKIDINDLKLARDEVLVVNCSFRFQNLPEGTELLENPMDGVLKLIRKMKPDLFVHSIVNGSYNTPFFMTRFREAFFYYASLFEVHDATLPRNDLQRSLFENELYGHEVLNIIACEGQQRVIRPETYKQWQIRTKRAGFKILPLEKEVGLQKVEERYHKHFLFDEDCNWMLQGWKGRVLYGSSCWVPV